MSLGPVIDRYLAEVRGGASDAAAVAAADKTLEDLERWKRNKAFREARREALEAAGASGDGGWVARRVPGSNMTEWLPVLGERTGLALVAPVPDARARGARPWERRRSVFSMVPDSQVMP